MESLKEPSFLLGMGGANMAASLAMFVYFNNRITALQQDLQGLSNLALVLSDQAKKVPSQEHLATLIETKVRDLERKLSKNQNPKELDRLIHRISEISRRNSQSSEEDFSSEEEKKPVTKNFVKPSKKGKLNQKKTPKNSQFSDEEVDVKNSKRISKVAKKSKVEESSEDAEPRKKLRKPENKQPKKTKASQKKIESSESMSSSIDETKDSDVDYLIGNAKQDDDLSFMW